jgi:amidophosphoribosyltransferase
MGKLGEATIFASETVALDVIGASYLRDVEPGELIIVNQAGVRSFRPFAPAKARPCIFEHVYFSRPDSIIEGTSVYEVRKNIGAELSREAPVEADIVVPVPDSGVPAALGFSQESKIPFELGIIRSHYVGRTFIQPSQDVRHLGVKLKHNANRALIEGKRVVLIDDSIVRGNTSGPIVRLLREAGASEVHIRVSSPPIRHPCFLGVDMASYPELIAHRLSIPEICAQLGADSLAYLSLDGLIHSTRRQPGSFCKGCFSGQYPVDIELVDKEVFEVR